MDLNLRDRTVVVLGPLSNLVQSFMSALTQEGANVVLVDDEANKAEKFCTALTDQREANEKNGRAMAIKGVLSEESSLKEALGKAAQSFGSIDVFVDAQLKLKPAAISLEKTENLQSSLDEIYQKSLRSTLMATQFVIPFLKGRKRGRILYLIHENQLGGNSQDALSGAMRSGLVSFAKAIRPQVQDHNISVNVLAIGLTEEYLLAHYSETASIKEALEKYKVQSPTARITEPERVAQSMLYLISNSGAPISGQVIHLR